MKARLIDALFNAAVDYLESAYCYEKYVRDLRNRRNISGYLEIYISCLNGSDGYTLGGSTSDEQNKRYFMYTLCDIANIDPDDLLPVVKSMLRHEIYNLNQNTRCKFMLSLMK